MNAFEVLLPIYVNDKAAPVKRALESVVDQRLVPSRIVIVCDGPIAASVESTLVDFVQSSDVPVKVERLDSNQGLGRALSFGLGRCTTKYVARMDADDVSLPERFAQQVEFLEQHPEVDVLGGHIQEFNTDLTVQGGRRVVPSEHRDIIGLMKRRNPLNHVSVMFNREAVLAAGGYRDCPFYEDYFLWVRMAAGGALFANLDSVLVHVRGGSEMVGRRGGLAYYAASRNFLRTLRAERLISSPVYFEQFVVRSIGALIPSRLRALLYRSLLRG